MAVARAVDQQIAELAQAQNGVITWRQLITFGLTPAAIRARTARHALLPVLHSVYAVADPALLPLALESAALLSLGRGTAISHRSAAALWGIVEEASSAVEVTLVGRHVRPRPGIKLHRVNRLHPADLRTRSNLVVTAPARTIIDLAGMVSSPELERTFGDARAKRLLSQQELESALSRAPKNHPGAAAIRRRLATDRGSTYTRSRAEALIRRLLADAQLPQPLVNCRVAGLTVDFLWPQERLVLEVDGYATHGHRLAFEGDRKRDQVLTAGGYTVIRITWRQLRDEPIAVAARIAQALAVRAA